MLGDKQVDDLATHRTEYSSTSDTRSYGASREHIRAGTEPLAVFTLP
jgi:hypothetical protein